MSKISKYVKLDKDILLEYIYNDGNLIGDPYDILVNSRDQKLSYIAGSASGTGNILDNQLFKLDLVTNKYAKIDTSRYSFLQLRNYAGAIPVRHDTIKIHLPINYTFGEHLGCYIRVYSFDYTNRYTYELSNFYFDMTNIDQQYLLNFSTPPLLFQEKLWGKNIQIDIPAASELALQRVDGLPKDNSVNNNLSNGFGLSTTSPVFIEYQFINSIQTINGVTTYLMAPKVVTSIPQTPEFEKLGVTIEESSQGDFFEIYGTYGGTIGNLNLFIENATTLGNRYYIQYTITMYEQNIRGKTSVFTVTDNFNETIEFRPIIKYSTTTAIIDVELRLIDAVDDSYVIRRASYGMLQNEISKYSLSLMKINLKNANKPKIYSVKRSIDPSLIGNIKNSSSNRNGLGDGSGNIMVETVKVPFPVLIDRFNIVAKSENVRFNKKVFYGIGKLQILIFPFDNIVQFTLATGDNISPKFMDLTNMGEIKLVIKNDQILTEFPLYTETNDINLAIGQVVFRIAKNRFGEIKRIYESGMKVFYITSMSNDITTVIYSGLYKIYDSIDNINNLNNDIDSTQLDTGHPTIIQDNSDSNATAIVTRKIISSKSKPGGKVVGGNKVSKKDSQISNKGGSSPRAGVGKG
jgi:hypothetical protein